MIRKILSLALVVILSLALAAPASAGRGGGGGFRGGLRSTLIGGGSRPGPLPASLV